MLHCLSLGSVIFMAVRLVCASFASGTCFMFGSSFVRVLLLSLSQLPVHFSALLSILLPVIQVRTLNDDF